MSVALNKSPWNQKASLTLKLILISMNTERFISKITTKTWEPQLEVYKMNTYYSPSRRLSHPEPSQGAQHLILHPNLFRRILLLTGCPVMSLLLPLGRSVSIPLTVFHN